MNRALCAVSLALATLVCSGCSLASLQLKRDAPAAVLARPGAMVGVVVTTQDKVLTERVFRSFYERFERVGVQARNCSANECPQLTERIIDVKVDKTDSGFDCRVEVDRLFDGHTRQIVYKTFSAKNPEVAIEAAFQYMLNGRHENDYLYLVGEKGLEQGLDLATNGQLADAVAFFTQAGQARASAKIFLNLALLYEVMGRYPEADEAFRRALSIEPGSMRVHAAQSDFEERQAQRAELGGGR
jgi:hypothetical protein